MPLAALFLPLIVGGCMGVRGTGPDAARVVPADGVEAEYASALELMSQSRYEEAEQRMRALAEAAPQHAGPHANLGILYARRGEDEAAEAALRDALAINPALAAAHNQLGVVLRRNGRFDEAESAYLAALEADGDHALTHLNLGILYDLYLGRVGRALHHYQEYMRLTGEDQRVARWVTDLERRVEIMEAARR